MPNKLRDLFDDSKQNYTEKVLFESADKYNSFLEAIVKATEQGIATEVDGVTGIIVSVKDGDSVYPLEKHDSVVKLVVCPEEKPVNIDIDTDQGKRTLKFIRMNLKDKVVLRNEDRKGALYQITYNQIDKTITVDYKAVYDQADSLDELIDFYNTLYYFTKKVFSTDVQNEDIEIIKSRFLSSVLYFERLKKLSDLLGINLNPQNIEKIDNEDFFIERVYFSLVENKAIRSNCKVTSMNNVHFSNDKRPGDNPMTVTYLEKVGMQLVDNETDVYIVNMAFNIIIENEEIKDNGDSTLYFKEDENNPMYIVSKIFLDEELARKELESALDAKQPYKEAKTVFEYIKESHDEIASKKE